MRTSKQRVKERGVQAAQQRGQRALVEQQRMPARHALGHAQQHAVGGLHASVSTQSVDMPARHALSHAQQHAVGGLHASQCSLHSWTCKRWQLPSLLLQAQGWYLYKYHHIAASASLRNVPSLEARQQNGS